MFFHVSTSNINERRCDSKIFNFLPHPIELGGDDLAKEKRSLCRQTPIFSLEIGEDQKKDLHVRRLLFFLCYSSYKGVFHFHDKYWGDAAG